MKEEDGQREIRKKKGKGDENLEDIDLIYTKVREY